MSDSRHDTASQEPEKLSAEQKEAQRRQREKQLEENAARIDYLKNLGVDISEWERQDVTPAELDSIKRNEQSAMIAAGIEAREIESGVYKRKGAICSLYYNKDKGTLDALTDKSFKSAAHRDAINAEKISFIQEKLGCSTIKVDYEKIEDVDPSELMGILKTAKEKNLQVEVGGVARMYLSHMKDGNKMVVGLLGKKISAGNAQEILDEIDKVNINAQTHQSGFDTFRSYQASEKQYTKLEDTPEKREAKRTAEIDKLFKDKDGRELPPEEKQKVIEKEITKLETRYDTLQKDQAKLNDNNKMLKGLLASEDPAQLKQAENITKAPVREAQAGLLKTMAGEQIEIVEVYTRLKEKIDRLPDGTSVEIEQKEKLVEKSEKIRDNVKAMVSGSTNVFTKIQEDTNTLVQSATEKVESARQLAKRV